MSKKSLNLLLVVTMLAVLVPTTLAAPPAQEEGQDYVVVADDWLSKLADKYLGNPMAYPAIVEYTNQKNAEDASYAKITDPDLIEVGWKIYVPSVAEAEAYAGMAPPVKAEPSMLVVAITGDVESLDVHMLFAPRPWMIVRSLYGGGLEWKYWTDPGTGLSYQDWSSHEDFQPGLLESCERREEDGKLIYTCHVRKGCKFASGNEMTAKDYKYRVARINYLSDWDTLVGGCNFGGDCVNILDDYTFEIVWDKPNAITDRWMEEMTMMVTDSEELKKEHTDEDPWAHEYMRTHVLGVGPYWLDHYTPGVEMLLVKNEDYCAPDYMQAHFDRVLFKIIPSVSDQMLMLKSGEIDYAPELPMKEALDLIGEPGVEVLSFESMILFALGFNVHVEPFDNVKVRQALAYATPYDDIINTVFLGQAQESGGLSMTGHLGSTDKYWVYEYDLDKAKALLAEAGYADGFDFDLAFNLSYPAHEDTAVLLKDAFAKIGVNANLVKMSPADFHERLYEKDAPDAWLEESKASTKDAGYALDMMFSSWGFANFGDWQNDEFDQILKDAWEIADPEVRLPMYDRAQEILDGEVPWIAICQPNLLVVMRDDIEGYAKMWDTFPRFHRLYRVEK